MSVSYIDDRLNERQWKIQPGIATYINIADYFERRIPKDILVIHGGQHDARFRAKSGRELLIEAVIGACADGGRAIVFSGGAPVIGARTLREMLSRESLQEGLHYLILTAIQNLPQEIDLDALASIVPSPDWKISEVKRRHAAPTLLTLALLCQSALLALEPGNVDEQTATLLGGRDAMAAIRAGGQPSATNQFLAPNIWYGVLGTRVAATVQDSIDREWPNAVKASADVRNLVRQLFEQQRVPAPDMVSRAFTDLYCALEINQESQR